MTPKIDHLWSKYKKCKKKYVGKKESIRDIWDTSKCLASSSINLDWTWSFIEQSLIVPHYYIKLFRFTTKTSKDKKNYWTVVQADSLSQRFILWGYYFDCSQASNLTLGHLASDRHPWATGLARTALPSLSGAAIWEPHVSDLIPAAQRNILPVGGAGGWCEKSVTLLSAVPRLRGQPCSLPIQGYGVTGVQSAETPDSGSNLASDGRGNASGGVAGSSSVSLCKSIGEDWL